MQFDVAPIYFHLNVLYTFREGSSEDFYGGIYLNPLAAKTYQTIFGLNPFHRDSFLNSERLKNDFGTFALALNTDILYPFIPFVELYWSYRFYQGSISTSDIPIEGCGINPFLFSVGGRYFFSHDIYLGVYSIINLVPQKNYIKSIFGFDFSLQF